MIASWFSAAKEPLNQLVQILGKYDMQMMGKTQRMYAGGDAEIEWLPVGNNRFQKVKLVLLWQQLTKINQSKSSAYPDLHGSTLLWAQ